MRRVTIAFGVELKSESALELNSRKVNELRLLFLWRFRGSREGPNDFLFNFEVN